MRARPCLRPSRKWTVCVGIISVLSLLTEPAAAVKEQNFKICAQSGFCKRNRQYADDAAALGSAWSAPYTVDPSTASFGDGRLRAVVVKTTDAGEPVRLPLVLSLQQSGTARVTMDEEKRQNEEIELRHDSRARKERYNEAGNLVLVGGLDVDANAEVLSRDETQITIRYGPESAFEAVVRFSPLELDFRRDGVSHVKLNGRGLLNMEHWRPKVDKPKVDKPKEGEEESGEKDEPEISRGPDESTWWEETFGGNTDSKPRGPESVALDISFPGYEYVFGIPLHAGPLSLKETRGGRAEGGPNDDYVEPYRLYNLDVFEYILDSPMTLYGAIPFMQAHRKDSTVGVFWLNAAETWVDITRERGGGGNKIDTHTHWISEAGILDVFVFLGPAPADVTRRYGELTGNTALPQEFSLGYHQCRWNYVSDDDVKEVDRRMDKHHIPYDVIWLDIEYTDDKKYFTWHPDMFADPLGMGRHLDAHGRKLVAIIDPHIKNADYPVSKALRDNGLAVRDKDGNIYEGWCWPGSSNWVDTFNPASWAWWKGLFRYDAFKGSAENTFIWNDMNEPSVFNGPETTMPKDNLHHADWEHRDLHNLIGMTFHNATAHAITSRKDGELRRPFVLTRSFFAGSQRLGAMWTGDNLASWEHLAASFPMILSQGVSGFPFAGADVGGFFGNPDKDLSARWFQAGAFYPFMRAHAHIDARRREPYLLGDHTPVVTAALRLRYSLLPTWYTAFFHASRDAAPILRPMYWTHPAEEAGFALDDQFFLGSSGILAKPVVHKDADAVDVWIPDDEVYYDYFSYAPVARNARGTTLTVVAPIDRIPVLLRGGHVVPRRDRPRRSSQLMRWDDYTLVVAVSATGRADGELYVDDGDSFDYASGQYIYRRFALDDGTLRSTDAEGRGAVEAGRWRAAMRGVKVDRVVFVGAPAAWAELREAEVTADGGRTWTRPLVYHAATKNTGAFAVISGLGAGIGEDWSVELARGQERKGGI